MEGALWGNSGGQLEYVSQRVEWERRGEDLIPVMVIRFTDHDVQMTEENPENAYYELRFPVFC